MACRTPQLEALIARLPSDRIADRDLAREAGIVLQSGRPIFLPEIPEPLMRRLSDGPGRGEALQSIAPGSLIVMPMTVRGHTIGVMSFLRTKASPPFDREDLSLAGQLGRRTALAADNARLYTEARKANEAKDEFLGMMSHELRTPITVIHGGARVLRTRFSLLDQESREGLLSDVQTEAERLSRMLENLLALARAELDGDVNPEPVLLQRLLPTLLESIGAGSDRALTFTADSELLAVAAEPGYIEHILRNLISNAIKYSPADEPIDVVVSACPDGATIRVLDRGFGISPEEAPKIFERFYRSDRTSRLAGGAGLGLAVSKRLVETMSGEIWAAPREGGGLEVSFHLPAYKEESEL
jgi:signal transduction histidine kinase